MAGLRNVEEFFSMKFNNETAKTPEIISSPLSVISPFIGFGLEAIIFFIPRIKILRGFIVIINAMIGTLITSNAYSLTKEYSSQIPMFAPAFVFAILLFPIVCFLYPANWICGSLQILIIFGSIDYYIIHYPWAWSSQKPFLISLSVTTAMTIIIALYYFEYYQRQSIFRRIETEIQRKAIKQILEKIPDPLIVVQKKEMKWANESFKLILGLNRTNLSENISEEVNTFRVTSRSSINYQLNFNKILESLLSTNSKASMKEVVENEKKLHDEEFSIVYKNDKKKHFEVNSVSLFLKNTNSILYLIRDLSNFHKVNDLKSKQKYQRLYFASITHDFRAPLSIISGNSELLLDSETDADKRTHINNIYNASTILSLLVQDILDFSQLKAGTMKINIFKFNLEKEFNLIIDLFKEKYHSKVLYL